MKQVIAGISSQKSEGEEAAPVQAPVPPDPDVQVRIQDVCQNDNDVVCMSMRELGHKRRSLRHGCMSCIS